VPKKLGVKTGKELNGATICVAPGTTTELNLADYFRANKMEFKPVVIEKVDEVIAAYFSGRCDVFTTDASGLSAYRAGRAANPEDHVILTERISKEPLAPVVRHGDDQWDVQCWWYDAGQRRHREFWQWNADKPRQCSQHFGRSAQRWKQWGDCRVADAIWGDVERHRDGDGDGFGIVGGAERLCAGERPWDDGFKRHKHAEQRHCRLLFCTGRRAGAAERRHVQLDGWPD